MRNTLRQVQSVVVKLGTQVLSDSVRKLDVAFLHEIAAQVAVLRQRGVAVTLVSSGAVGAGMSELKLAKRPTDLATLQAVAAVGQRRLMDAWAASFAPHGLHVAQVLLTREDIDARKRFLNLRNTIHAAQELGAVPVINENDTISTDEMVRISFGDNDILAANVAGALRAELLVILSNVDGVLDTDGKPVRTIPRVEDAAALVRTEKSQLGKGGMNSKFEAARMMTRGGEMLVVAHGRTKNVLVRLLDAEEVGTLFLPSRADALTLRDVIELTRAGLGEEVLLALIEVDRSVFPIDAATIKELKANGVSERVITAMVRSGREVPPPEPIVTEAPQPVAPQPQVVIIDHRDPPEVHEVVREVPVAVPVYIPVATTRSVHTRADHGANGIPISSDRWIAEHMPQQQQPVHRKEPEYWGFGGKLRPDAWKPVPDPSVKKQQ